MKGKQERYKTFIKHGSAGTRNSVLCAINILHFLLFRDARGRKAISICRGLANVLQPSATLYVSWFPLGSFWSSLFEMPTVSIFLFMCFLS